MIGESLALADGRTLCYARYGDPAGFPVFYFHGWPGSRLEGGLIMDLPVQIIALDRPGYGGSAPQAQRRLLDWPADVATLADRLGLARFGVLGVSGGGPYAAACAYALPARVAAAVLLCPVPPPEAMHGVPVSQRGDLGVLFGLGRHPRAARPLLAVARRFVLAPGLLTPGLVRRWGQQRMPARDQQCLDVPVLTRVLASFREGIRPGIEGIWSDAQIYARPWGFSLAGARVPLRVWHGSADTVVPVHGSLAYAGLPPEASRVLPDEGHYSLVLAHARQAIGLIAELARG